MQGTALLCPVGSGVRLTACIMPAAGTSKELSPAAANAPPPPPPLYSAAGAGDLAAVSRLLAARADPNARSTKGETPLHAAARAGHRGIMQVRFVATACCWQ